VAPSDVSAVANALRAATPNIPVVTWYSDLSAKDKGLRAESWAFQQIADRLEGKPSQIVGTTDDRDNIDQFTDAELTAILRQRLKVVPVESDDERPDDEPLN
jgi:hypothetical protein